MTIRTALIAGAVALTPLAAQAEWRAQIEIDRITGERLAAGIESVAVAEKPRPKPFGSPSGWLYLSCDGGVIFGLIDSRDGVFLEDIEFGEGGELPIRARVDDRVAEFRPWNFRNEDDGSALFFSGDGEDSLYSAIVNAGKLLLEIPTVEYGEIYFPFSLAGTRELHDRTCGTDQSD